MVPQWIIEQKRDNKELSEEDLRALIAAYAEGDLPDYQMAAFAMAVYFRGMTFEEITVLTDAMMRSGDILDLRAIDRPTVDKHSTGGIGDKISIPLAPLVAAAGAAVPMISGRGLGITGGTLDKLESIPGYQTQLSNADFMNVLKRVGCSIIGQTDRLAPADKKLYALRDVTGTVPSIPLIAASILSKKLAEGVDSLVFDVKCGRGAFMKQLSDARQLAETLVRISRNMGRRASALISDMNQPLGRAVGHTLEIAESIAVLKGEGPLDVTELTIACGADMLVLSGLCTDNEAGRRVMRGKIDSGEGLETFLKMVEAQGGDLSVVEHPERLPQAPVCLDVLASGDGFIDSVNADAIGRIVLLLGGGRRRNTDTIDHAVGIDNLVKVGERVAEGDPMMRLHARTQGEAESVMALALGAVLLGETAPEPTRLVVVDSAAISAELAGDRA